MKDHCCVKCKGFLSICRQKTCWHHIEAQTAKDDGLERRTYRNPTQDQALNNIMRERKGRRT